MVAKIRLTKGKARKVITRSAAIERAKELLVRREEAIGYHREIIKGIGDTIDLLRWQKERAIVHAGDHVANLTGRYEEILEMFGLNESEIEGDRHAQAAEDGSGAADSVEKRGSGTGCACNGCCRGSKTEKEDGLTYAAVEEAL